MCSDCGVPIGEQEEPTCSTYDDLCTVCCKGWGCVENCDA